MVKVVFVDDLLYCLIEVNSGSSASDKLDLNNTDPAALRDVAHRGSDVRLTSQLNSRFVIAVLVKGRSLPDSCNAWCVV